MKPNLFVSTLLFGSATALATSCSDDEAGSGGDPTTSSTAGPTTSTTQAGPTSSSSSSTTGATGGGGGGGGGEPCVLTGTWSVVDDYVFAAADDTPAISIAVAPDGTVFVRGLHSTPTEGLVRTSTDGGANWSTSEGLPGCALPRDIAVDDGGAPYVGCAEAASPMGPLHTIVKRSDDGGATFGTVEDFTMDPTACFPPHIARGLDGNLTWAGLCGGTKVIRRSTDDGMSWSTVATAPVPMGSALVPHGAMADGTVFFTGPDGAWVVRRVDSMGMVTIDDSFEYVTDKPSSPFRLAVASRVYVSGGALDANDQPHALVRARDSLGTWSTIDDVGGVGPALTITRVLEHPSGTLVYLHTSSAGGANEAITRISNDGGQSWQNIDTYAYVAGQPTNPTDVAVDPQGNVYSAYAADDATTTSRWVVRKMDCR